MNKDSLKQHYPALVLGFAGAVLCQILLAAIIVGFYIGTPLKSQIHEKLQSIVEKAVIDKNLTDSAGQHSDVIDVVDAVSPSVVSIVISKDVPKMEQNFGQGGQLSPFEFFGMLAPQYQQNGTEKKEIGGGSGFIVSEDGYVVTNAHVVSDNDAEYTVLLNSGETYVATVVAADSALDVAVLKIDISGLPFIEFGDSDTVKAGQSVIAIGNALGQFRNTVSVGVISGLARSITAGNRDGSELLSDVLQTDAAINPGNSGGPLLDLSGKVIGMNVATSSGGENISFALPSNMVHSTVDSIRKNGRVVSAYLGVRYTMLDEVYAAANGISVANGALVQRGDGGKTIAVVPGSPADKAGIEENDIIIEVDGVVLDESHPLGVVLHKKAVGDTITLMLLHDGAEKTVTATLAERPAETK